MIVGYFGDTYLIEFRRRLEAKGEQVVKILDLAKSSLGCSKVVVELYDILQRDARANQEQTILSLLEKFGPDFIVCIHPLCWSPAKPIKSVPELRIEGDWNQLLILLGI